MDALVQRVSASETFDLRRRVLRPHQTIEEMTLQGEEAPDTAFFAARDATSGIVLATASVQYEAPPWEPQALRDRDHVGPQNRLEVPGDVRSVTGVEGANAWRLRAMATADGFRGQGLGRRVLEAVIDHVSTRGGGLLWCAARIRAVPFYARAGFSPLGDFYEEPVIGTHVLMWRVVAASTT